MKEMKSDTATASLFRLVVKQYFDTDLIGGESEMAALKVLVWMESSPFH